MAELSGGFKGSRCAVSVCRIFFVVGGERDSLNLSCWRADTVNIPVRPAANLEKVFVFKVLKCRCRKR
jgi:hypothetical protein